MHMVDWKGDDIADEDLILEPDNNEPPKGGDAEVKVRKLKNELEQTRAQKQEYMDGWQRAKADYVNLLKRIETDNKLAELKGKVGAVESLLPAFDALERSKEHGELPEGFLAIAKQLESAFQSIGLEGIGSVGEKFTPILHEALGQDPVASLESDDTITVVLEKGWKIGDTIIRPAKVRVGSFASAQ